MSRFACLLPGACALLFYCCIVLWLNGFMVENRLRLRLRNIALCVFTAWFICIIVLLLYCFMVIYASTYYIISTIRSSLKRNHLVSCIQYLHQLFSCMQCATLSNIHNPSSTIYSNLTIRPFNHSFSQSIP